MQKSLLFVTLSSKVALHFHNAASWFMDIGNVREQVREILEITPARLRLPHRFPKAHPFQIRKFGRPSRSSVTAVFFLSSIVPFLLSGAGSKSMWAFTQQGVGGIKEAHTESLAAALNGSSGPGFIPGAFHTSCSPPLQLLLLSGSNKGPTDCPLLPRPYQCGFTWDFPRCYLCSIYSNEVSCETL